MCLQIQNIRLEKERLASDLLHQAKVCFLWGVLSACICKSIYSVY